MHLGFYNACMSGDLELVKEAINNKIVNNKDDYNIGLLYAIRHRDFEMVQYLVSIGADVTAYDNDAIISASYHGDVNMLQFLVSKGANPNAQDNWSIIAASMHNNIDVVKFLISVGTDPTSIDNLAINSASNQNYFDTVQYLASKGCDTKRCTEKHQKIFRTLYRFKQLHCRNNFRKICRNLLQVYYSPNFTGGILAKKDLQSYCNKMKNFIQDCR